MALLEADKSVARIRVQIKPTISGVGGSGQVASVHLKIDVTLGGASGTGAAGSPITASGQMVPIFGNAGTGQVGVLTVQISRSPSITGASRSRTRRDDNPTDQSDDQWQ